MDKEKQKQTTRDAAIATRMGVKWCLWILRNLLDHYEPFMHESAREYIKGAYEQLSLSNDFIMDGID